MRNFTLGCGHTYNRKALVTRAISCEQGEGVCPHCSVPFTSEEGFYLEYSHPKQTMEEFRKQCAEEKERIRLRRLTQPPPKPRLPTCSGTCLSGKKCTKVATRASGVFCNLHS
jgi:hypothetical protein